MGEFERIDRFLGAFAAAGGALSGEAVPLGPGDDAALLRVRGTLAVTTDALVEGVHFRRAFATAAQVGHKALAVNLSDLAAMGARPTAFTCALALPADVDDAWLDGLARGLAALAARHGVVLAGGNFTRAGELSLTLTALGELPGQPLLRTVARPGDAVMLVGDVGVAAAELLWLEAGRALPPGPSALHEPEPRCEAGLLAARRLRCGIDVSDGLVQDLGHVAKASGVRVRLDFQRIPRTPRFDVLTAGLGEAARAHLLLAGGEDYALALCGPAGAARELGATVIGRVEEGSGVEVDGLPPGTGLHGHDHFGG